MSDYLLAALLGVVEGLTEFLPISSTAHLRIVEALLGISLADAYWKTFSIVIQLGAVLCLPIYFRRRLLAFARTFPRGAHGPLSHPLSLTLVAFVATAVPAFLLTRVISRHLESLVVMGWALLVGGVVMGAVDLAHERRRRADAGGHRLVDDLEQMTVWQALWIGGCQTLSAVFPGTSRSMATITAGELVRLSRPAALEFSFLVSMPTMAAATLYDLAKSLRPTAGGAALGAMPNDARAWIVLAIGFVVSFVVAYAVVAWFMAWVRTRGFTPFAVYRVLLGGAVLWFAG